MRLRMTAFRAVIRLYANGMICVGEGVLTRFHTRAIVLNGTNELVSRRAHVGTLRYYHH